MRARRHEARGARVLRGVETALGHRGRLLGEDRGEAAAGAGAQGVLVVRENLEDLEVPNELQRLPGRLEDLRDPGHVTRIMERDLLRERFRECNALLADQLLAVMRNV